MATSFVHDELRKELTKKSIQQHLGMIVDDLMSQLPPPEKLSHEERRGIIARYAAVLEGNFIYWMTATLLAIKAEGARPKVLESLYEECRDSHPERMRRFAIAARAFPTHRDAQQMSESIDNMRVFLGQFNGVPSLVSMAFFEGWMRNFMAYLAELARLEGSTEMEYTDAHGVCGVAQLEELLRAVQLEIEANPVDEDVDVFEGVDLLSELVDNIVEGPQRARAAA